MYQYRSLEIAYQRLAQRCVRRPPMWLNDLVDNETSWPTNDAAALLDQIVTTINDDRHRRLASDEMIRRLIAIGRDESDAITVVLHALAPRLRSRISCGATAEYHSDALATLAMVCLDSDLNTAGLGSKLLNRAHNRTFRAARQVRHHGFAYRSTTDPCYPDVLIGWCDSRRHSEDMAEHVVIAADLARFAAALTLATTHGQISETTVNRYRDLRLSPAITPTGPLGATNRTLAYRASKQLAAIVNEFLGSHAA